MFGLESLGRLKCRATGLGASLSSFSNEQVGVLGIGHPVIQLI